MKYDNQEGLPVNIAIITGIESVLLATVVGLFFSGEITAITAAIAIILTVLFYFVLILIFSKNNRNDLDEYY